MTESPRRIIFFDGFCILCNGFVDFVFKRDKAQIFRFASLQGNTAKALLKSECVDELKSIVYVEGERCEQRSSAVISILIRLGGFYKVVWVLRAVPRPLRDFAYDFIAKHRYRWFGKRDSCRLRQPKDQGRLLD